MKGYGVDTEFPGKFVSRQEKLKSGMDARSEKNGQPSGQEGVVVAGAEGRTYYPVQGEEKDAGRKYQATAGENVVTEAAVWAVVGVAVARRMLQAADKLPPKSRRKVTGVLISALTILGLATGCAEAGGVTTISPNGGEGVTQSAPLPTTEPTERIEVPVNPVQVTPTAEIAETPTVARPEFKPGAGGAYTAEQQQLIESGALADKEAVILAWVKYWGNATNTPLNPESWGRDIFYYYLFPMDQTELDKTMVGVVLLGDPYYGKTYFNPIKDGKFMTQPPTPTSDKYTIPEGFGPLEVSGGAEGLTLVNVGGQLVRVDSTGQIAETIDMATAQWVKAEKNVQQAISIFNLNSERTYTVVDNYLVDGFNQAKMAKWENGAWVGTTLEEKYGHLITEVYSQPVLMGYGNIFFDGGLENDGTDRRYENVQICGNSTGNLWVQKEEIAGVGIETDVVYGEFVFRDAKGRLKLLKVRVDVIDPEEREHTVDATVIVDPGRCFTSGSFFAKVDTPEEEVGYFGPGSPVIIIFSYKRPDQEPQVADRIYRPEGGLSNLRNRANYHYWVEHKKELGDLAEQLLKAKDEDFSKIIIPAQFVRPLMSPEEAFALELVEWAR
jgi:hypothetical protein